MNNKLFLKRFKIKKLFGTYNVDIPFDSNINIFIGENGLGKTTILNALNYVLQGDGEALSSINFEEIEITFGNDKNVNIKHDDLSKDDLNFRNKHILMHYYNEENYDKIIRFIMIEMLKNNNINILDNKEYRDNFFEMICQKYNMDFSPYMMDKLFITIKKDKSLIEKLKKCWEYKVYEYMKEWKQIIYLPTYRRIEEDFNNFVENYSDKYSYRKAKRKNNFLYLQFGMDDVQKSIEDACNTLKNNTNEGFKGMTSNLLTSYIGIENEELLDINNENFDSSKLEIVFSRLADKIDKKVKDKIIKLVNSKRKEDTKYLLPIIKELTNIYEKNKQIDDNIENFKNVCNNYLVNKKIKYDKFKIECKVELNKSDTEISLKNLSSGEKQIISLFSKLYLNLDDNNIILFDEPELSLSLIWQKKIIPDIINSKRCGFIMTITHSPFIFDNEYKYDTKDIKEFITFKE